MITSHNNALGGGLWTMDQNESAHKFDKLASLITLGSNNQLPTTTTTTTTTTPPPPLRCAAPNSRVLPWGGVGG